MKIFSTHAAAILSVLLVPGCLAFVTAQTPGRTSSKTPSMALITGASFEMGQAKEDIPKLQEMFQIKRADVFSEEIPKHSVKLSTFYLDKYEVTNAEFKKFIEANRNWSKNKIPAELHNGKYLADWNGSDFPVGKANYPVAFVSWYVAVAFCQSQGKRLPTEAEWEFAARGGLEGKAFPWGDESPDKTRVNFGQSGFGSAVAVGSYPPNGYGLFDMAGNVWEFLADEWAPYSDKNNLQVNPVTGGDFFLNDSYLQIKTRRAIRGGSYGAGTVNLRVTYRDSHLPTNAVAHVGFRCAMTAAGSK